jgi:hypothetical protein
LQRARRFTTAGDILRWRLLWTSLISKSLSPAAESLRFCKQQKSMEIVDNVIEAICTPIHSKKCVMRSNLLQDFDPEYEALRVAVQEELLSQSAVLERFGPDAGRPRVDTLKGSKHANMKELRFDAADGVWGFAFAFDPKRRAVILVGGDKSGIREKRFYRRMITKADERFDSQLAEVEAEKKQERKSDERNAERQNESLGSPSSGEGPEARVSVDR